MANTINEAIEEVQTAKTNVAEALINNLGVQALDILDSNGLITSLGLQDSDGNLKSLSNWSTAINNTTLYWADLPISNTPNNETIPTLQKLILARPSNSNKNTELWINNSEDLLITNSDGTTLYLGNSRVSVGINSNSIFNISNDRLDINCGTIWAPNSILKAKNIDIYGSATIHDNVTIPSGYLLTASKIKVDKLTNRSGDGSALIDMSGNDIIVNNALKTNTIKPTTDSSYDLGVSGSHYRLLYVTKIGHHYDSTTSNLAYWSTIQNKWIIPSNVQLDSFNIFPLKIYLGNKELTLYPTKSGEVATFENFDVIATYRQHSQPLPFSYYDWNNENENFLEKGKISNVCHLNHTGTYIYAFTKKEEDGNYSVQEANALLNFNTPGASGSSLEVSWNYKEDTPLKYRRTIDTHDSSNARLSHLWRALVDESNIEKYMKGKNAGSADKWSTPRKFTFTGDVTGSMTIDGSEDILDIELTLNSDTNSKTSYTIEENNINRTQLLPNIYLYEWYPIIDKTTITEGTYLLLLSIHSDNNLVSSYVTTSYLNHDLGNGQVFSVDDFYRLSGTLGSKFNYNVWMFPESRYELERQSDGSMKIINSYIKLYTRVVDRTIYNGTITKLVWKLTKLD